jgi:hypothetical protein
MMNKLANYRRYKEEDFARSVLVFSMIQPDAVPFYGLQFRYGLDHCERYQVAPSVNVMLALLLEQYQAAADRLREQTTLEGLMPPAYHQWIDFERPYPTPYGEVGGYFLWDCKNQGDLAAISANWTASKRARFYQWVEETPASWALDVLGAACDEVLMTFIFNPTESLGERWQRNSWMDCPFNECVPAAGDRCPRCAEMLALVPRWITLLQALLLGFFQEVEIKERVVTETRAVKRTDNPKKKKRIQVEHRVRTLDVSRRVLEITPEEREALERERSWIAGREVLTLDQVDWEHPPADESVVLAPVPVRRHRRTFKANRFTKMQGQTIIVGRYEKPRQPMTFATWKRRQWDFVRVMASEYEAEKTAGSLTQQ